jgi:hypothetical protein
VGWTGSDGSEGSCELWWVLTGSGGFWCVLVSSDGLSCMLVDLDGFWWWSDGSDGVGRV